MKFLRNNSRILALIVLCAAFVWANAPVLKGLMARWSSDQNYQHGFLVPLFAGYLLWKRRERFPGFCERFSCWGMLFLGLGATLSLSGAYLYFTWFSNVAILCWLAGIVTLLGGPRLLLWAAPGLGFLIFMIPLPYSVQIALGGPLQRIATLASTYLLQTFGFPALAEGNVIVFNDFKLGIVEACSGLGMLVLFFAVCTGATFLTKRAVLDRILMIISAIPIAVACNVIRITATGILHETVGERAARLVFHDLAGYLMMPMAVGMLAGELWLISCLLVIPPPQVALPSLTAPQSNQRKSKKRPAYRAIGSLLSRMRSVR